MINAVHVMPTVLAAFLASLVEFVEALTVVLAVGSVRGWKAALLGTAGALLTLAALVLLLGRSLTAIPLYLVQTGVGLLLLLFGLRWLRKAVLRAARAIPLHDEDQAFAKQADTLRAAGPPQRWDPLAFATAYKIVMLEGIEVVFIVIALGSSAALIVPAAAGAAAALACVTLLGVALHRPLSRIPENGLKFTVGILLCAFGTFWVGEGIGIRWPIQDASLLALAAWYLIIGGGLVVFYRRRARATVPTGPSLPAQLKRSGLLRLSKVLVSLFIDDGWLAIGTLGWAVGIALALRVLPPSGATAAAVFTVGLGAILSISATRAMRRIFKKNAPA